MRLLNQSTCHPKLRLLAVDELQMKKCTYEQDCSSADHFLAINVSQRKHFVITRSVLCDGKSACFFTRLGGVGFSFPFLNSDIQHIYSWVTLAHFLEVGPGNMTRTNALTDPTSTELSSKNSVINASSTIYIS